MMPISDNEFPEDEFVEDPDAVSDTDEWPDNSDDEEEDDE